MQKKIPR